MKLFELITTKTTNSRTRSPYDMDTLRNQRDKRFDHPDKGSYAYGNEDPKDPHMFDKKHHFPSKLEIDPYYQYVQAIKPYIPDNPFFPRVYVVNIQKDSDGVTKPDYKIEKLQPGSAFSDEALMGIGERLFNDYNEDEFRVAPMKEIADRLYNAVELRRGIKNIKDPQLLQAIKLIKKLIDSNPNYMNDMHPENIMFRGTSVGPQLVLMDPIFDGMKQSQIR